MTCRSDSFVLLASRYILTYLFLYEHLLPSSSPCNTQYTQYFQQQDYRGQQIETLRANGKTQEEIDAIVPKTISEVRQKEVERKKSAVDMQTDIAFLLQEVQDLRKMIVAKDSGGSHVASDSDKHNMNTNQGAKSAPWDSSATLGMQNGASIKTDRQIVDAVLSNT